MPWCKGFFHFYSIRKIGENFASSRKGRDWNVPSPSQQSHCNLWRGRNPQVVETIKAQMSNYPFRACKGCVWIFDQTLPYSNDSSDEDTKR